jgi:hypothetical protein
VLIILPFLGAIIYMVTRPKMTAQDLQMITQAEAASEGSSRRVPGRRAREAPAAAARRTSSARKEFQALKAKALA